MLVLHGDQDAITPWRSGQQLAAGIPHATFQLLSGASHGYHLEHPDVLGPVIDFLNAHPLLRRD